MGLIVAIVLLIIVLILSIVIYKMYNMQKVRMLAQKLWIDHMWWTREYLIRYVNKLPDVDAVAARLLKNQDDLAQMFNLVYPGSYDTVKRLLTEHIVIATELVSSMVNNAEASETHKYATEWTRNATDIANALASLNHKYNKTILNNMMQTHLKTTSDELAQILAGKSGINEFETALDHMLHFNNYLMK